MSFRTRLEAIGVPPPAYQERSRSRKPYCNGRHEVCCIAERVFAVRHLRLLCDKLEQDNAVLQKASEGYMLSGRKAIGALFRNILTFNGGPDGPDRVTETYGSGKQDNDLPDVQQDALDEQEKQRRYKAFLEDLQYWLKFGTEV